MLRMAKRTLSGLLVRHAMRRQVIALPQETAIDPGINHLIKYKVNALLVTGARGAPVGVVSKSDIMGAYYAGLSSSSPLEHIMAGPPLFCRPDEALETALDTMRNQGVYRLYVTAEDEDRIIGVLASKPPCRSRDTGQRDHVRSGAALPDGRPAGGRHQDDDLCGCASSFCNRCKRGRG